MGKATVSDLLDAELATAMTKLLRRVERYERVLRTIAAAPEDRPSSLLAQAANEILIQEGRANPAGFSSPRSEL